VNREGMDLENNTNFPSPCPHTSPWLHDGGSGGLAFVEQCFPGNGGRAFRRDAIPGRGLLARARTLGDGR
jgi:hypothetical protein